MKKQKQKHDNKTSVDSPLVWAGLGVAALCVLFATLLIFESDLLWRVQELNLFLYTPLFFKQQLVVAGGLLTYLGTYFTQFFYHPWMGIALLCAWIGLMTWLIYKAFRVPLQWAPLLLAPAVLVLLTDFDLGYWVYYLKLRGHFFIAAMGTSMAVGLAWLYRVLAVKLCTKTQMARFLLLQAFIVITAACAYPIAGFYGLMALALMAVITWRIAELTLTQKCISSLLACILLFAVPFLYYRQVYYQANSDFILWQALPTYPEEDGMTPYYYPYVLLGLFLVLLAALYRASYVPQLMNYRLPRVIVQLTLSCAILFGCWHFWFKDKTFHEEIQMNACVDNYDWEGVLNIVRQHEGEPTRMIVMYKNLALFKLGRAGNEMYNYPDGSKEPDCPYDLRMAQIGGKNIYLHYGLPNYCYRWCLEDGVETGWRAEHLKFLVRCSLLNGEWQVARKYIDLLKQTKYYAGWAAKYEALATPSIYEKMPFDPEFAPILRLMKGVNQLGSDQAVIELFLLNLQAHRVTDDVVCAELAVLSALQLKDIKTFWRAFNQYARLKTDGIIPRHFQEAAYLYGNLENTVDISHMPFDPSIPATYNAFFQAAKQCNGMSDEQIKVALAPIYGNTFFFNYFLMRGLKTY